MIIYLCIKFESNTLIFSKDIEQKPFFDFFFNVEEGPQLKKKKKKKKMVDFTLNRTWPIFYNYMLVYRI